MGKISPDTFNQSKQYVNVRLQQGVPIVDADWNEMDDIRKHEHQTFLQAFVGNGVPQGSNSFQIQADNSENNFQILGGTPEQQGLCLVDGWEIQINETVNYTAQRLYGDDDLADSWQVAHLESLTTPGAERIDTVYLDAWERLVDSTEDPDLLNPLINIETCLRRKRDWVVRVAEGTPIPDPPAEGHVYYPLARLTRSANQAIISTGQITDLRTPMAMAKQNDVEQIAADAFGSDYTLDQDGQPNLKISLREAINALLRGTIPTTPMTTLTTATFDPPTANYYIDGLTSFTDSQQVSWVFWCVNGYDSNKAINEGNVWYKRYNSNTQQWETDQTLSTAENVSNYEFKVLQDQQKNIWLFWNSSQDTNRQIYYQRYVHATKRWESEQSLTRKDTSNDRLVAINDREGDIWVFWDSYRTQNYNIYFRHYLLATNTWEEEQQLTTTAENDNYYPTTANYQSDIWVFWVSQRPDTNIYYQSPFFGVEYRLTNDAAGDDAPFAFTTSQGELWIFWLSTRTGSRDIWYRRAQFYLRERIFWGGEIQLNTGMDVDNIYQIIEDSQGGIWVFWQSNNSQIYYKRYNGAWGLTTQLTTSNSYFSATKSHASNIWTFGVQNLNIQHQQFIPVI